MGKIATAGKALKVTRDLGAGGGWRGSPTTFGQGRNYWNQVFYPQQEIVDRKDVPAADPRKLRGRSNISPNANSFIRLLDAMRSNAPGGWTDDRYEQTLRHFTGITYVAIHRLCQQLSRAEFQVFYEDPSHPDGRRPVGRDDPPTSQRFAQNQVVPYDLVELLKKPNRHDSFGKWMYRIGQQRRLTGSGLNWLVPNAFGVPYEMYCIPTAIAIPQAATNPNYPEGYYRVQPIYPYGPFSTWPSATTSVGAAIPAEWMWPRFQYPHPMLRYEGYSPLTGLRLHIDSLEMIDKARHYMMRRGIQPNAVLNSTDVEGGSEELNDDVLERIKAEFESDHMGPENLGKLFVAYAGFKLEKWGDLPADMAFEGGWEQLTSFILGGGFGITKPAAGMIEDASYAGLFATLKQLHLVTLEPECDEISQELTRHVAPYFGDNLIVHVRLPRIDDHEIKFAKLGLAATHKVILNNELRKELDLPMVSEPWGNERVGMEPPPAPLMPVGPGQEMPLAPAAEIDEMEQMQDEEGMVDEMSEDTGDLGMNSQGPEEGSIPLLRKRFGHLVRSGKGLGKIFRKEMERPRVEIYSTYDLVRKVLSNGNGKH